MNKHTEAPVNEQRNKRVYIAVATLAYVVVIICAALAWNGNLPSWEQDIFKAINGMQGSHLLDTFAKLVSNFVWLVVGIVVLAMLLKKYRLRAWNVAVRGGATFVADAVLEQIVGRARPEALLSADTVLRASQGGLGFPSGHVATLTAVTVALWQYIDKPYRYALCVMIVLEAWSRVYLGVHFPLDVIAGFALGIAVPYTIKFLPNRLLTTFKIT